MTSRHVFRLLLLASTLLALLGSPSAALAETGTVYLVFDGITSPSKAGIPVNSYDWGLTATAGKSIAEQVSISTKVGAQTIGITKVLTSGKRVAIAKIIVARPNSTGEVFSYFEYHFEGVAIGSIRHSGGMNNPPTEQVTFTYDKLTLRYRGSSTATWLTFSFDFAVGY